MGECGGKSREWATAGREGPMGTVSAAMPIKYKTLGEGRIGVKERGCKQGGVR